MNAKPFKGMAIPEIARKDESKRLSRREAVALIAECVRGEDEDEDERRP
jgi:hypothetical protein